MSNVIGIRGGSVEKAGEPREELARALDQAAQMARDGKLQGFIGTGFTADGFRMALFGGETHDDCYKWNGALHWLAREFEDRVLGLKE